MANPMYYLSAEAEWENWETIQVQERVLRKWDGQGLGERKWGI